VNFKIPADASFNFHSVIRSHGWYALAPFVWNADAGVLQRTELLASGQVVLLQCAEAADGIAVRVPERVGKRAQQEIAAKAAWMFSLDLDLREFYAVAANEPRLAHVPRDGHGRFLRSTTLWEDVVKVMLTTNIQWSGTKRLVRVLTETFGAAYEKKDDAIPNAFPSAEAIARTREGRLRKLGLGYRAPYLLQLARGVADGKYDLAALCDPTRPTDELRRMLLTLPGIGPYAAATLLMLLGRYEFLGVDTEALRAVSRGLYDGKPVTEKEVQAAFAQWGKYKALAYWFWNWDS
jgi:3-methyladenine DNA glycosylase/8-oxoguanine DNA glycosylase